MNEYFKSKWLNFKKYIVTKWFGFKIVNEHDVIINVLVGMNKWFDKYDKKSVRLGFTLSASRYMELRDEVVAHNIQKSFKKKE